MGSKLPPEIWFMIMGHLPFFAIRDKLGPTCRTLRNLTVGNCLHRLTPEIWQQIFSNLEFFDLLRARQVCMDFKWLLSHTKSRGILANSFREVAAPDLHKSGTHVKLHPVLESMCITPGTGVTSRGGCGTINWSPIAMDLDILSGYSVLFDQAISPPIHTFDLTLPGCDPAFINPGEDEEDPTVGVTVGTIIYLINDVLRFGSDEPSDRPFAVAGLDDWSIPITLDHILMCFSRLDGMTISRAIEGGRLIQMLEDVNEREILHETGWLWEPMSYPSGDPIAIPLHLESGEDDDL